MMRGERVYILQVITSVFVLPLGNRRAYPEHGKILGQLVAICLMAITVIAASATASSEENPIRPSVVENCNKIQSGSVFDLRPGLARQIISRFIATPSKLADEAQIRSYLIYAHILGNLASSRVYHSSQLKCFLVHEIDILV
jgi:hypothetical protein